MNCKIVYPQEKVDKLTQLSVSFNSLGCQQENYYTALTLFSPILCSLVYSLFFFIKRFLKKQNILIDI